MTETLLLVKRDESCDCYLARIGDDAPPRLMHTVVEQLGETEWVGLVDCPHGTTVEVIPARVVECEECSGTGNGEEAVGETETGDLLFVECPACLGSGLRLVGCRPLPLG